MARRPAWAAAALAVLALVGCKSDYSVPTVRIALDFTPNAAHAPIFAQAAPGRSDINIEIRQPSSSTDSLKLLTTGRADLAVLDIHDLGLARERGEDIVGVAALIRRPLASVIAQADVRRPRDLEGRRVGVTGLPSDDAVLRAVVEADGGRFDRVRRVTIGFTAVPSLVARKVAAVTAFWNVEGVTLRRREVSAHEFRLEAAGARYPELVLVTTREKLESRRDDILQAVSLFAHGVRTGSALQPGVLATVAKAGQTDIGLLRAEAKALRHSFPPGLKLDPRALRRWAEFDVRYGILKRPPDLARAFDTTLIP